MSPEKIDPLPPTDLARVATLSLDRKYQVLSVAKSGWPPFNYRPLKSNVDDILNVNGGMFPDADRTPWPIVRRNIRKACRRSKAERVANVQAAWGLHNYAVENHISGQRHVFRPLLIAGRDITFWSNMFLRIDGRLYVPFFDPRRTKGLTPADPMRFVFSAMHEHIRAPEPDFKDLGFVIFRFADTSQGPRVPVPFFDHEFKLFSFEELDRMVRETYETLAKVFADRAAAAKKAS